MPAYDLLLPSRRVTPADGLALALETERSGWRGLWCSEVLALDTVAFLAAVAARTERLRLGTAVVPLSTRSVALLAMGAATVAGLAPGRFLLGVGTSTPEIVARRHARPVARPLAEAREALRLLRALLAGERVTSPGPPAVEDLRVEAPEAPPRLGLAALGPRMTALAVEHADALFLNLCPFDEARRRAAAARAARGSGYETFLLLRTCADPDAEAAGAVLREVASYARVPAYRRQLEALGHDLGAVAGAGDLAAAARALPPELARDLALLGSAAECRARLDALVAGGVTPLVVPSGGPHALRRTLTALAP